MNHKINLSEISIMDFSFDQDHFSVVPGCYLNLNKKIIQNFYHLCSDKSILDMLTEENPTSRFTLKNAQRFLEETIEYYNKKHFSFFLIKNEIVGIFMVKDLNPIPEIGYFLKKSYRGKGIGKKYISFMIDLLSKHFDGFDAIVDQNNVPSLKILQSLNFKIIDSKKGKYKLRRLF
jgi:RimJ/RimL family protein N-acetyltransferase